MGILLCQDPQEILILKPISICNTYGKHIKHHRVTISIYVHMWATEGLQRVKGADFVKEAWEAKAGKPVGLEDVGEM